MKKFGLNCSKQNYIRLLSGYARCIDRKLVTEKGFETQGLIETFEKIKRKFTLNVAIYNTLFKVMAKGGLLGVMVEYYGEMLQNRILPNVETSLYFTLALAKRMNPENITEPFLPLLSNHPEPKSIIKIFNDMLLKRLSFKYSNLPGKSILSRVKRDFGKQELLSNSIKDMILKMGLDDGNDADILIQSVSTRFIFSCSEKVDFMKDFNPLKLRTEAYSSLIIELCKRNLDKQVQEKFNEMIHDGITPPVQIYTAIISMLGSLNDLEGVNYYLDDMRTRNVNPNIATYNEFLNILSMKNSDLSNLSEFVSEKYDQNTTFKTFKVDLAKSKAEKMDLISSITFKADLKPSKDIYHRLVRDLINHMIPQFSSLRFDRLNYMYGLPKEYEIETDVPFSVISHEGMNFELEDNIEIKDNLQPSDYAIKNPLFGDYMTGSAPSDSTMWLAKKIFDDMVSAGVAPHENTFRCLFLGHIARNEINNAISVYLKMMSHFNIRPSLSFRLEAYSILLLKGQYNLLADVIKLYLTSDINEKDWIYIRYLIFHKAIQQESKFSDSITDQVMNLHSALCIKGGGIHKSVILDALYFNGFVDENYASFDRLWTWIAENNLVDGDSIIYYIERLLLAGKIDEIMYTCTTSIVEGNLKLAAEELKEILLLLDRAGSGLLAGAIRLFWRNKNNS